MAHRPAFFPLRNTIGVDDSRTFEFKWNAGLAFSQKMKNVRALHASILDSNPNIRPLEVSSKSFDDLGVRLSAFNLSMPYQAGSCTVESVFQASKVFEGAGPFPRLYMCNPREVRDFVRKHTIGNLIAFDAHGTRWELNPTRAFYDWVYMRALEKNQCLAERLYDYDCFTDIEFNPKKSLNCQAYAVALYVSMQACGVLKEALSCREAFLKYHPADILEVGIGRNLKKSSLL